MIEVTPIIVTAIVFGFIYGMFQLIFQYRERKLLVEKGADPSVFQLPKVQKAYSLRYGLLLIGVALGIFLGGLLANYPTLRDETAYFSMIFLFGGIALVISHFLERRL